MENFHNIGTSGHIVSLDLRKQIPIWTFR